MAGEDGSRQGEKQSRQYNVVVDIPDILTRKQEINSLKCWNPAGIRVWGGCRRLAGILLSPFDYNIRKKQLF